MLLLFDAQDDFAGLSSCYVLLESNISQLEARVVRFDNAPLSTHAIFSIEIAAFSAPATYSMPELVCADVVGHRTSNIILLAVSDPGVRGGGGRVRGHKPCACTT